MKKFLIQFVALNVALFTLNAQQGQLALPGQDNDLFDGALLKLFEGIDGFTSEVAMEVKGGDVEVSTEMKLAMLNQQFRMEIDLTKMQSEQLPAEALAMMSQLGMDQMTSVSTPKDGKTLTIFPKLKAYAEQTVEAAAPEDVELKKEAVGDETVNGYETTKNKISFKDESGKDYDGFAWLAKDLKNFPVKLEFTQAEGTVVMNFKNVKLEAPAASGFSAPEGFQKYDSVEAMMQSVIMRSMGGVNAQ